MHFQRYLLVSSGRLAITGPGARRERTPVLPPADYGLLNARRKAATTKRRFMTYWTASIPTTPTHQRLLDFIIIIEENRRLYALRSHGPASGAGREESAISLLDEVDLFFAFFRFQLSTNGSDIAAEWR